MTMFSGEKPSLKGTRHIRNVSAAEIYAVIETTLNRTITV